MAKYIIKEHTNEAVKMVVLDDKTGKRITIEKPRSLVMMERLFKAGMEGDVNAMAKWLDRAAGKPAQPIVGDDDEPPVQIDLGIGRILEKAYGNALPKPRRDKTA